jgi:hypothetical protein
MAFWEQCIVTGILGYGVDKLVTNDGFNPLYCNIDSQKMHSSYRMVDWSTVNNAWDRLWRSDFPPTAISLHEDNYIST